MGLRDCFGVVGGGGDGRSVTGLPLPGTPRNSVILTLFLTEVSACLGECLRFRPGPLQKCGIWRGMGEIGGRKGYRKKEKSLLPETSTHYVSLSPPSS